MKQYIHCVLQYDDAFDAHIVECFKDYKEAISKKQEYETEYTQEYYVESIWLYEKGEEE